MKNTVIVRAAVLVGAFVGISAASATPTLTTIINFNRNDIYQPNGNLVFDGNGNLYGATAGGGGAGSYGAIFKVAAGTQAYSVVTSFPFSDTSAPLEPTGSLTMDAAGDLFGTAAGSYVYDNELESNGAVFKIAAGTGKLTTVSSLTSPFANEIQPGAEPGLVTDSSGDFYGTTESGGTNFVDSNLGDGTLFELNPNTGVASSIINFNNANGNGPNGNLIKDNAGNLYGTTGFGGAHNEGTAFRVTPGTGTITTLVSFNGSNGSLPLAGLIADSAGDLFGTTGTGGASNDGTVFEIAAGTGLLTTLATFNGSDGSMPEGELVMDRAGNLYGTTSEGGTNSDGTIFEISASTQTLTTLENFNGTNGSLPDDALTPDSAGNLYGLTQAGGSVGGGTVYELSGSGFVVPEPSGLPLLVLAISIMPNRSWRRARPAIGIAADM